MPTLRYQGDTDPSPPKAVTVGEGGDSGKPKPSKRKRGDENDDDVGIKGSGRHPAERAKLRKFGGSDSAPAESKRVPSSLGKQVTIKACLGNYVHGGKKTMEPPGWEANGIERSIDDGHGKQQWGEKLNGTVKKKPSKKKEARNDGGGKGANKKDAERGDGKTTKKAPDREGRGAYNEDSTHSASIRLHVGDEIRCSTYEHGWVTATITSIIRSPFIDDDEKWTINTNKGVMETLLSGGKFTLLSSKHTSSIPHGGVRTLLSAVNPCPGTGPPWAGNSRGKGLADVINGKFPSDDVLAGYGSDNYTHAERQFSEDEMEQSRIREQAFQRWKETVDRTFNESPPQKQCAPSWREQEEALYAKESCLDIKVALGRSFDSDSSETEGDVDVTKMETPTKTPRAKAICLANAMQVGVSPSRQSGAKSGSEIVEGDGGPKSNVTKGEPEPKRKKRRKHKQKRRKKRTSSSDLVLQRKEGGSETLVDKASSCFACCVCECTWGGGPAKGLKSSKLLESNACKERALLKFLQTIEREISWKKGQLCDVERSLKKCRRQSLKTSKTQSSESKHRHRNSFHSASSEESQKLGRKKGMLCFVGVVMGVFPAKPHRHDILAPSSSTPDGFDCLDWQVRQQ